MRSLLLGYLLLAAMMGCNHRAVKVDIPNSCIRPVAITNFTKPCKPISGTLAVCDGVEIHYSCVRYNNK